MDKLPMGENVRIAQKEIVGYLSELGNNNFLYPAEPRVILTKGSEFQILPWVSGHKNKLYAILVSKKNIIPLTYEDLCVNNILLNNKYPNTVIWAESINP
jgi:hypothetical protein